MPTDQGEPRYVMIEREFLTPIRFIVALLAAAAELFLVRIIGPVAGHARGGERDAVEIAGMTAVACDPGVPSTQYVFGVLVVVETNGLPFLDAMASLALGAIPGRMDILQPVAGDASRPQVLVEFAAVTA